VSLDVRWDAVWNTSPDGWDLEEMYRAARGGELTSASPYVVIATPAYQPPELAYLDSVAATIADLRTHGVRVSHHVTGGDSLVTRPRHVPV